MAARLTAFAILPAALLGGACGGGGGSNERVDVEDWVADVCDLAIQNDEDTSAIFDDLNDIDLTDRNAKDDVVGAFEEARDAFDTLEEDFNDVGIPDIEKGSNVRKAFRDNISENRRNADRLISELRKLDSGRNFERDFSQLLDDIDIEDPDLRSKLEDINERDVDDLIDLIDEDPDCSAILFDN
jgi:hypothetical protein